MKRENLPRDVLERIENELLAGEELLWVGRPSELYSGTMGSVSSIVTALIKVMIALIILMGLLMLVLIFASMWWVIVIVIGLAIIVAAEAIFQPIWRNRNKVYAVTDRRALLIIRNVVQSYGPHDIKFIERRMRRNGRGDIIFAREVRVASVYFSGRPTEVSVGFFGIDDPRTVEALMLEVFRPMEVYGGEKHKHDEPETQE